MTTFKDEILSKTTEELLVSIQKSIWTPAALDFIITEVLRRIALEKAEQQFTGFHELYTGGDVIDLITSMGLKPAEWEQIKNDMPWLSPELVEEVNEHFVQFPHQA